LDSQSAARQTHLYTQPAALWAFTPQCCGVLSPGTNSCSFIYPGGMEGCVGLSTTSAEGYY